MFEAFLRFLKRHKFQLYWTFSEMFPYRNKESKTVHLGRNVTVREGKCDWCGSGLELPQELCADCKGE